MRIANCRVEGPHMYVNLLAVSLEKAGLEWPDAPTLDAEHCPLRQGECGATGSGRGVNSRTTTHDGCPKTRTSYVAEVAEMSQCRVS